MPVAKFIPEAVIPPTPNLPTIEPKPYKSILTDDTYTPLTSLITYVEGAPWTIHYYSQVLTQHQDLRDLDPGQDSIYQQYTKIVGLEIRVTNALSSQQDAETTAVTVNGEALMYPCVTPNVGDLFIGETGDNHDGLFRITNVERKKFNRDSVFSVEYELMTYLTATETRLIDLENKVIRTYHFSKERLLEGLNPNVIETEHQQLKDLSDGLYELTNYYFKIFFNREFSTLIVPGQSAPVYDSYVVDYVLKIVDTFAAYEVRFVKQLTTDHEAFHTQPQFWEALYNRDYAMLTQANQKMGLIPVKVFAQNPMIEGIRFTKIQYLVYPIAGDESLFSEPKPLIKPEAMTSLVDNERVDMTLANLNRDQYVQVNRSIPYVQSPLTDSYYVLSEAFYKDQVSPTVLEGLTLDYFKGRAIAIDQLHGLVKNYRYWNRLTQYYAIPIVMTLIKATLKQ